MALCQTELEVTSIIRKPDHLDDKKHSSQEENITGENFPSNQPSFILFPVYALVQKPLFHR